jgi:acylphosphatase
MNMKMHLLIKGNVQGVGFRATAKREAEKLGLKGFARNLADGNVEIIAQGSKSELEMFLLRLKSYFHDTIEDVDVTFSPGTDHFDQFSVH